MADGEHKAADAITSAILIACISACFFSIGFFTTMIIRTFIKYRRQQRVLWVLLALWVSALLVALAIFQFAGNRVISAWVAGLATIAFAVLTGLVEVIEDQRSLHGRRDDSLSGSLNHTWWE